MSQSSTVKKDHFRIDNSPTISQQEWHRTNTHDTSNLQVENVGFQRTKTALTAALPPELSRHPTLSKLIWRQIHANTAVTGCGS